MPTLDFVSPFPHPETPSQGAWDLAVALIAQTDFSQPELTCILPLEKAFPNSETISQEWLQEALGRARSFGFMAFESADLEEPGFDSMSLFVRMGYRDDPRRVEANLHPGALAHLKLLRLGIHQLYHQDKLTPSSLTRIMKTIAPLTVFKMKKDPRYKAPIGTLFMHRGRILENPIR